MTKYFSIYVTILQNVRLTEKVTTYMMIHLEGINKTYFNGAPLHVLKGIDLDIEKGEMVSIMGASGSGKSICPRTIRRIPFTSF